VLFEGETVEQLKLLVTLCHRDGGLVCIKPTSNATPFKKNRNLAAGCVFYPGGALQVFPMDTYVDPANSFFVAYSKCSDPGVARAVLPADFHDKLVYAIKASYVLSLAEKKDLLAMIDAPL
jgi:hypothetical protein